MDEEAATSATAFIFRNATNEESSKPLCGNEVWVFQVPQVKDDLLPSTSNQNENFEPFPVVAGSSKMSEADEARLANKMSTADVFPSCSGYLAPPVNYNGDEEKSEMVDIDGDIKMESSNSGTSCDVNRTKIWEGQVEVDYITEEEHRNDQEEEHIDVDREEDSEEGEKVTYLFDFMRLPMDMVLYTLQFLSVTDIRNVMLTCKWLHYVIKKDNYLWKRVTKKRFVIYSNPNAGPNSLSWYDRNRITYNWLKGYYQTKVMMVHNQNFMSWLTLCKPRAMLISLGSELRCYPLDKNEIPVTRGMLWNEQVPIVKRYDIRTNDISRFVFKNGIIVCGNRDGCVSIYRSYNIRYRPQLVSHLKDCHKNGTVEVSAVELVSHDEKGENAFAITASGRSTKVWYWNCPSDIYNPHPMQPIGGVCVHDGTGVRCLAVNDDNDLLAVGPNGNSRGVVFDINTGSLMVGAADHGNVKQAVRDIGWHDQNTIMYVTHSGVLQMIDIRTGGVVFDSRDPFLSTLYCVKSDRRNAIFVGASEYTRTVLFDTRNAANHLQLYFTQKKFSPTYSMDYDTSKLIVAADRSVASLDFNVAPGTVPRNDYSYAFELVYR